MKRWSSHPGAGALFLLALFCADARAESVPLPVARTVEEPGIRLDLRGSRVELLVSPDREARIEVFDIRGQDVSGGYVVLETTDSGDLAVRQPYGARDVAPEILVRIVIPPGRRLAVHGERLDIDLEAEPLDAGRDVPRAGGGAGSPGPAPIRLDVDDSTVRVTGLSGLEAEGTGSHYDLASTHGSITARLEQSSVQVVAHRGRLVLSGRGLDIEAESVTGALRAVLDGGALTVRGGEGRLDAEMRGGQFVAERWRGSIKLTGRDGFLELRDLDDSDATVRIDVADTSVTAAGIAGGVSGQLRAGRLEAQDIGGAISITARDGAEAELKGLAGTCRLDLQEGSVARVANAGARLQARLTDAELAIEGALELDLKAERSAVDIKGIERQIRVVSIDSDLDLDFSSARGQIELQARGTSLVRIRLPEPCTVKYDGSEASRDALSVGGCEIVARGERRPRVIRPRGGRPPVILEAKVDPQATVEVTGVP